MVDTFASFSSGLSAPANEAFAITPDDATDLSKVTRGLYIGGGGNVSVILVGDTTAVSFTGVLAGTVIAIRVQRVRATGTSATSLVGLV